MSTEDTEDLLASEPREKFAGEIRVAARIIDYISRGLYESPAACLKELVNNSYDADATLVEVFVKPDADRIIIEDNGSGISRDRFQAHFAQIAESHKRDESEETPSGRPKIGKIGIGFVAANELCDVMEIYSTERGSEDLLHVTIDFSILREEDDAEARRKGNEFVEGDYEGEILAANRDDHFTRIFLTGVRGGARHMFVGARRASPSPPGSLYGLKPESIVKRLRDASLRSWSDLDWYSETMLRVGLNVPVKYHEGWLPSRFHRQVAQFEDVTADLNFTVRYDGTELRKPVVLWPHDKKGFVRRFDLQGDHVSATGYIYAQHGVLRPQELNGVLLRVRNAAVGGYNSNFWDYPSSRYTLFQRWVSAEVWASDELEEAMNIDRQTLRVTHPAYLELQEAFHARLEEVFHEARTVLHGNESARRRTEKASRELDRVSTVIDRHRQTLGPSTHTKIEEAWEEMLVEGRDRILTRRLALADLYDLVIETALETLDPSSARTFLRALTRRLTK